MKNAILTFIFAFVPGAGQMYQGYMKRGLTLIALFCLGFCCGYVFQPLFVLMLIVWMYSFFDTFNLRAQIGAGTAPKDGYLIPVDDYDTLVRRIFGGKHKLLGWALIFFGAAIFYQNVLMNTLGDIMWRWGQNSKFFRAVYLILDSLPEIAVCVILVACGVWLVRGPRGAKRGQNASAPEQAQPDEIFDYSAPDNEPDTTRQPEEQNVNFGEEAAANDSADDTEA